MTAYLVFARTWLEANVHPMAPWAALAFGIWLGAYLVRKYAPNLWERAAMWGPNDARLTKVWQALPSVIVGAAFAAWSAPDGQAIGDAVKGAVVATGAPLWHHLLKASPLAYRGGSPPAVTP